VALAVGSLLCASALTGCEPPPAGWSAELVSINATGDGAGNAPAGRFEISPDGTKIAFETRASNLGPTDTNNGLDIYLRDLTTGTTTLVTTNSSGTDSGNSSAGGPAFSPDGTKLAFTSSATDLGPGDQDSESDLYVADLTSGQIHLVTPGPQDCGSAHSGEPAFSPDGSKLVYSRRYWDMELYNGSEIYVHDLATGVDTRVTRHGGGPGCTDRSSGYAGFSPDGTSLLFTSDAGDLGPVDTNGTSDVYTYDLVTGGINLISANSEATDSAGGESTSPTYSSDGQAIVFASTAGDLGPTDGNGSTDIYQRDLATNEVTVLSTDANGQAAGGGLGGAAVSPSGSMIAFMTTAHSFGVTDTNGVWDVYARDMTSGETTLVSANADGTDSGNSFSGGPQFLDDDTIVFGGLASDLGPPDAGIDSDVYLRELTAGRTTLLSANADRTDGGNGLSNLPGVSSDGSLVAFLSEADDLGPPDANGERDIYLSRYHDHADLQLGIDASADAVAPGDRLTYQATVTNNGPDDAPSARLTLALPEGVRLVTGSSPQGNCDSPDGGLPLVVCGFGRLAPGAGAEASITVEVTSGASTLQLVGVVLSDVPDTVGDNGTVTVETPVTP
jgi:uncharacterized repeat protein (TIGR01451 family)